MLNLLETGFVSYKYLTCVLHTTELNKMVYICIQDGSLPFARSIKDIQSEFRLLSKLTELLMNQGEQEEALQYATLAVEIANKTGTKQNVA